MSSVLIDSFAGIMPKLSPDLLPTNAAQIAVDCYLGRGVLSASKNPLATAITLLPTTKTIYWFHKTANGGDGFWFQFNSEVDVVRGQIANDANVRTYMTGVNNDRPLYTTATLAQSHSPYPTLTRWLGLPTPDAPIAAGPIGSPPTGGKAITTSYYMTYISDLGEESAPSPASNIVDRWDSSSVALSGLSIPSGQFNIVTKRIYRIELAGVFEFVADIPVATTVFTDDVDTESLGAPCPSETWDAPNANMRGLLALPNGVMMGFWGNTIALCESYLPHAWPVNYRLALDYDVVGAAMSAYGVIVVTAGNPYLLSGSSPGSMQAIKLDVVQAGVSKRSVVDMGDYVLYASSDGLVAAGGKQAQLMTADHITPEQWRKLFFPSTIHAYRWDNRYLAFYDNGAGGGAFSFSPDEGFRLFSQYADCGYVDDQSGVLYIKQGTLLKKWGVGDAANYVWKSKKMRVSVNDTFAACKVLAENYPVQVFIFSEGGLLKNINVMSKKAFRLPTNRKHNDYEIMVSGSNTVRSVQLASSMSEIL